MICIPINLLSIFSFSISKLISIDFYQSHYTIINLILYFIIFSAIVRYSMGAIGISGRTLAMLSLSLGLMLSVALLVAEKLGIFSPKVFIIIALALICLLAGIVAFKTFQRTGAKKYIAMAITYLLIYVAFKIYSPGMFKYFQSRMSIVNSIIEIGALVSIISLIFAIWRPGHAQKLMNKLNQAGIAVKNKIPPRTDFQEEDIIVQKLNAISRKGEKDCEEIIQDINRIIHVLKLYGTKGNQYVRIYFKRILPKEHKLKRYLNWIKELGDKLENFETQKCKAFKKAYKRLPKRQQHKIKEQIQYEKKKIKYEKRLEKHERRLKEHIQTTGKLLIKAINSYAKGFIQNTIGWLEQLTREEERIKETFEEMRELELKLHDIIKKQIKHLI